MCTTFTAQALIHSSLAVSGTTEEDVVIVVVVCVRKKAHKSIDYSLQ